MSDGPKIAKWLHQVVVATATLVIVALGARVAWALLEPLVPGLVVLLALVVVYAVLLGRLRK